MAGTIDIKPATKLRLALDVPAGKQPAFNMISTFNKALDESAFLVSIPLVDGKAYIPDENQKILFQYGAGEETQILAGYVDDVVKEGIRRYWKVRRVMENRQFIKRVDVRMKVELPILYMQDTWSLNALGEIDREKGMTADISNNGLAAYMNRWFQVGESCVFTLPRMGGMTDGQPEREVVGVVCWTRELPKGGAYRYLSGIQLRFADTEERGQMQEYVAYVKKRYRL
ncbi:MAG: PilZ domain-containing protein [Coprococcus sp.]|nr:PilZ domain-containing protein [Coprococcus sp.]